MKRLRGKLIYELKRHPAGDILAEHVEELHQRAVAKISKMVSEGFNCGGILVPIADLQYVGTWELK